MPENRSRYPALDSLRGLAALCVLLFHMNWTSPLYGLSFVRNSYLMVDLFFVLSGFVIVSAYGGAISTMRDLRRFLWLRFWRLYPVHLLFLAVFVLIEVAKSIAGSRYGIHPNHPAPGLGQAWDLVANLLLIHGLNTTGTPSFNGPSWSISVECGAYVLFAGLSLIARSRTTLLVAAPVVSLGALALLAWLGQGQIAFTTRYGILPATAGFFLGVAVYGLADRCRGVRHLDLLAAAMLVVFVLFVARQQRGYEALAIFPISAALVLLLALAPSVGAIRVFQLEPLRWLGAVSYSLYMAQAAVIWCVKGVLRVLFAAHDVPVEGHEPVLSVPLWAGAVAVVLTIPLALCVAHLSYSFIERPWRSWSRRFRLAERPLAA